MFPCIHTSILTINGEEICRITHMDEDLRKEFIDRVLRRHTPILVDHVPQKWWEMIRNFVGRGMKIDAIKLIRVIVETTPSLVEAKEAVEFIATVEIKH